MTLTELLARYATRGELTHTSTPRGRLFTYMGPLGAHGGRMYSVAVTVIAYRFGGHRADAEVWLGDVRVVSPPLEANWPAVKAVREMRAMCRDDEVIMRLLVSILPK